MLKRGKPFGRCSRDGLRTFGDYADTDAGRTVVWGDPNLGAKSAPQNPPPSQAGVQVLAGQSVSAGSYTSNFTTADTNFIYGPNVLGLVSCNSLPLLTSQIHPTFVVSATVDNNCAISATNINFGSHGILNAAVTASGQLMLKCTPSASYAIALSNGNNGTGPTARKMILGSAAITYGLYKDAGFAGPWGDTGGTTTTGSGNGANSFTVFGRVPAQATPAAGTYNDTIIVTITY